MIVQETADGLLLFRQTDHALLSGAFAAAWGWSYARRDSVLVAAARHDDGWAEWELAPSLRDDGTPVDFIGIGVPEHTALYRRGIDLVEAEDPYAGLVVSMHGERLYSRPFHPGMDPRIEHLSGSDLDLARAYVEYEVERQERLAEAVGDRAQVLAEAEEAWRLLQVWDRLSLFVCMRPLDARDEQKLPAIRGPDGEDVVPTVRGGGADTMFLAPSPFGDASVTFEVAALFVPEKKWPDEERFRRAYRSASPRTVRFRCEPERT